MALYVTEAIEEEVTVPLFDPLDPHSFYHSMRSFLLSALIALIAVSTLASVIVLWWMSPEPLTQLAVTWNPATRLLMTTASAGVSTCLIVQFMVMHHQIETGQPVCGVARFCVVHAGWRRMLRSATLTVGMLALLFLVGFHITAIWAANLNDFEVAKLTSLKSVLTLGVSGVSILGVLHATETLNG